MFKELFESKEIDIQATLLAFAKANKPFPMKALESESHTIIRKKLTQWSKENKISLVYKGK